jgi:hypothetical protein
VIISLDKPFYVSSSGTGATGMQWPALVPLTVTHQAKVFVMSADSGLAAATISHLSEFWAD